MRALDALTRRRAREGRAAGKPKGTAMTGRTAAYGRAAFAWAVKRGMVQTNPFAHLPVSKAIAKRERVLSDDEIGDDVKVVFEDINIDGLKECLDEMKENGGIE